MGDKTSAEPISEAMRRLLVENARRKRRLKRGGWTYARTWRYAELGDGQK